MLGFILPVLPATQIVFWKQFANTGLSKTNCIGFLDIAMNEDHSRVRKDQTPENFAIFRHIALNFLKQEKTTKGGIYAKQIQAGWKEDYLLKVLASAISCDYPELLIDRAFFL